MNSSETLPDQVKGFLTRALLFAAIRDAFLNLDPRVQLRSPVTLGVCLAAVFTTTLGFASAIKAAGATSSSSLSLAIAAWLWSSVLLANFAEAIVGRREAARAAKLLSTRRHFYAKRLLGRNRSDYHLVEAGTLRRGDAVLVEANDLIPADGTVIEGEASVSEGAVTGESAPVLRAARRECSSVRAGARVLSDWLVIRVRSREGFFDPIVSLSEDTSRLRSRREFALSMVLAIATIVFLLGILALAPVPHSWNGGPGGILVLSVLVALVVCCIPTVTRVLIAATGAVGMHRLMRANVITTSATALEMAAVVDLLVLDKTGTITLGDRHAVAFHAAPGTPDQDLIDVAQLASLADDTPEGRSIVVLARQLPPQRFREDLRPTADTFHKFSAQTCISGVDQGGRRLRKGAAHAVRRFVEDQGGIWPSTVGEMVDKVARTGATPLVVADGTRVLGMVELRDVVKFGIRERCVALRDMGIRTLMVTGDNHLTAMAIAADVGVDHFLAEATPDRKLDLIRTRQQDGRRVAMCGDGTNDAPALAQADLAIVMNTGTLMAKAVGDMVDLDSNPAKFIEIAETGRQTLRTRQLLTTSSIAADLAKYFLILGTAVAASFPQFRALNVMELASPLSAIVSAAFFSALYILIQIPFALAGWKSPPPGTVTLPPRNLLLYGLGAILITFVGVKGIDAGIVVAHLV